MKKPRLPVIRSTLAAVSIRRRFVVLLAAFSVVLAALFGYMSWRVAGSALEAELDQRMVEVAGAMTKTQLDPDMLAMLQPGYEDMGAFTSTQAQLDSLAAHFVADAWIIRPDGTTVVTRASATDVPVGTQLRLLAPYQGEIRLAQRDGSSTTPIWYDASGRGFKYGFIAFGGLIMAVQMPADLYEPLGRLQRALIFGSLFGLGLSFLLGTFLAANIALPLERLVRAAGRIQRGYLDRPVRLDRDDELGRLAEAMERMRQGVLERDEQLRLMLAQVAHEIRNPLGGMELFATAAIDAEDRAEREQLIGRVRGEVGALNRIINEFLAFARPTVAEIEAVDLRLPVREAIELATARDGSVAARVELLLPREPLQARAAPEQVKRVVLNLVQNAFAVSERVVVRGRFEGGEAIIAVADDGPGVPEDQRDRIFDPFVTDKEKGAGLGLAIVKRDMEAMGGRVEVGDAADSGSGTGAEFRVYFPGFDDPPDEQN
ncbi:sensor histidine kinase [Gaopeijia maritima]|uniref:histidine kinase n=1 Tax=Gaopeijia maritima TaxID=3119007 RepID=A0ABU9E4W9_9BACT